MGVVGIPRRRMFGYALFVLSVLAGGGCTTHNNGSAQEKAFNQRMANRIASDLRTAGLNNYNINIRYRNGHALLIGTVDDENQKAHVTQVVQNVGGVNFVQNDIGVTNPSIPVAQPEPSPSGEQPEKPRIVISGGTGFFITDSGHLLTNHHVIKDASQVTVFIDEVSFPARLIQAEPSLDLAVLKIEKQVKSIPLTSSKGLRMGNPVFTIGFPNTQLQGVRPKYTNGRVSSLSGIQDDPRKFQITVPIQPGNSGGPLVDERGNVVGIVSSSLRDRPDEVRQLVNYAVKSSFALAFLETLTDVVELLPRPTTKQATDSVSSIQRVKDATVRIRVEQIR